MAIDFTGLEYVSTDGAFKVALADLSINTWINAFTKVADHVFGNEAASKASTAKSKAPNGEQSEDEKAAIILEARTKYLADMVAGTWGEKGNRAPRTPGATRLDQIRHNLTAEDTRKALAKAGYKAGEAKNTWIAADGNEYPLDQWMGAYLGDPELGESRKADIERRATRKLEAEIADSEDRKAAREREAKVAKGGGLSL